MMARNACVLDLDFIIREPPDCDFRAGENE